MISKGIIDAKWFFYRIICVYKKEDLNFNNQKNLQSNQMVDSISKSKVLKEKKILY